MSTRDDHDLQDPRMWDAESAETRQAVKNPRAVVSVSLSRDDFEQVAEQARRRGMKVSAFVREAALAQARREGQPRAGRFTVSTGRGGLITENFTSSGPARVKQTQPTRILTSV